MSIFKKAHLEAHKIAINVSDSSSFIKVGDPVRFLDQWRDGVYITGVVTEVGCKTKEGFNLLRVRPITEKGLRREFYTNSKFVELVKATQ